MVPESLQKILQSIDYPEYAIDILKLDISSDLLLLEFQLRDTEGSDDKTTISMTASGYTEFNIVKHIESSYIHLENDHPLLWRFKDAKVDLYISGGRPKEIEKVIFDLLQINDSLFKQYLPFDLNVLKVLNNGHGHFKEGPKKLLTQYSDSLIKNGVTTSIISEIVPSPEMQNLKIIFLGECYVIADGFEFEIL